MSAAPTIQAAREVGVEVRVSHYRPITSEARKKLCSYEGRKVFSRYDLAQDDLDGSAFAPHGGLTLVVLNIAGHHYQGIARCSSRDNFSRKRGRDIALGRAWARAQADYEAGRLL